MGFMTHTAGPPWRGREDGNTNLDSKLSPFHERGTRVADGFTGIPVHTPNGDSIR